MNENSKIIMLRHEYYELIQGVMQAYLWTSIV